MKLDPLIHQLIEALRALPSIGPKSAQRIAYYLLDKERKSAKQLAHALVEAADKVRHCQMCRTLSENPICTLCTNPRRNKTVLCVVENPADVLALEQSTDYNGIYFVLMGHLSPLDGIGPQDLGIAHLMERIHQNEIKELILATNPTVEGDATAHYIASQLRTQAIKVTRIAHGVPVGGELEYIDGGTLAHAFMGRHEF